MRVRVQRWGNSLAVRIPNAFALEMGLQTGCPVDLSLRDRRLVLKTVPAGHSLKELLARVTEDNLQGELLSGKPAGREVW